MASGYVVAVVLEAAGLIGLAIALVRIRAERRVKRAGLRNFLQSGQNALSGIDGTVARGRADSRTQVIVVPYVPARSDAPSVRESAARSALGRAIVRNSRSFRPNLGVPLSAR